MKLGITSRMSKETVTLCISNLIRGDLEKLQKMKAFYTEHSTLGKTLGDEEFRLNDLQRTLNSLKDVDSGNDYWASLMEQAGQALKKGSWLSDEMLKAWENVKESIK